MTTRLTLSIACLVLAGVSIPLILRKVAPNHVYGFRTKLTLSTLDIWRGSCPKRSSHDHRFHLRRSWSRSASAWSRPSSTSCASREAGLR